jgi:ribosome-associated translation inhibitor RaiA
MTPVDIPIEFKSDIADKNREYYILIEDRLWQLAEGHSDITGAAATLEQPAAGRETDYIHEASIVVYTRPNNVSAVEKNEDAEQALRGALDAIARQIREQRGKLREDRGSLDDLFVGAGDAGIDE